jgi:GntR family transcriptional regulator
MTKSQQVQSCTKIKLLIYMTTKALLRVNLRGVFFVLKNISRQSTTVKQYITVDNSITLLYTVYNRREHMKIIINNTSMVPIYEQIMEQIKAQIISGELKENDILPSVRTMAKELKISALTVKKAYDNLEAEGMTVTVHGKGTYVAASNTQLMEEARRKEVEADLEAAIQKGRRCGMKEEEIRSLFELIMEDE